MRTAPTAWDTSLSGFPFSSRFKLGYHFLPQIKVRGLPIVLLCLSAHSPYHINSHLLPDFEQPVLFVAKVLSPGIGPDTQALKWLLDGYTVNREQDPCTKSLPWCVCVVGGWGVGGGGDSDETVL